MNEVGIGDVVSVKPERCLADLHVRLIGEVASFKVDQFERIVAVVSLPNGDLTKIEKSALEVIQSKSQRRDPSQSCLRNLCQE